MLEETCFKVQMHYHDQIKKQNITQKLEGQNQDSFKGLH